MKKKLLQIVAGVLLTTSLSAQTTLFSENFETGGTTFTLNSNDLSGSAGTSGTNYWILNNAYNGGTGSVTCLGFPFSYTIANSAAQPGGITGSPNSTYMHIISNEATTDNIFCSSFSAADGFCFFDEFNFSKMVAPISTVGFTGVTFNFWWMCGGGTAIHGEVYYSTDGGTNWIQLTSPIAQYKNQSTWIQQSITNAAFDNQASLMFGFRFVNTTSSSAVDPGFSIDDVTITGTGAVSASITTNTSLSPASWCEGVTTTMSVGFNSTGAFNGGNVYTAQMSDATGSFAAPTNVGTLASSASGALTINATIPGSLPAGTGYRIRVIASDPATTGSDNGTNLVINPLPTVTQQPFVDVCLNAGLVNLVGASPAGGTYTGVGVVGSTQFDAATAGLGTHTVTYTYTDGNGCTNSASETVSVIPAPTVTLGTFSNVCDTDGSFSLTGGVPTGGIYQGTGVTGGVFDPGTAGVGTHAITYEFTDVNGCSGTATQNITVDNCSGLNDLNFEQLSISPNPTSASFVLNTEGKVNSVLIYNMQGQMMREFSANTSYDVSVLEAGVYLVIADIDGTLYKTRLVVR